MTTSRAVAAALERAEDDRASARPFPPPEGRVRRIVAAFGDPQAPFQKLLEILDRHRLLGDEGRLRPDVRLVSVGDHFDYGKPEARLEAARSGTQLLAWLAAHPEDQVTILLGNHDLVRAGEHGRFDDATFSRIYEEALTAYRALHERPELEAAFLARYPMFPTSELVARDYGTYTAEQRALVTRILLARRGRLAYARDPSLLVVHAGVTRDDLLAAGVPREDQTDAVTCASGLNAALEAAVARWQPDQALDLGPLHTEGSATYGEGRGILYQRPSHPDTSSADLFEGPPRRRYDPRTIPLGLAQAIGHIRDGKCRKLLRPWLRETDTANGPLRSFTTDGASASYGFGVPANAVGDREGRIIFLDGGMSDADPQRYELLDLATRVPLRANAVDG